MLQNILYKLVTFLVQMHNRLLSLNDQYELYFSDKQLHFWVIGILGMLLLFVIHPLFTLLAKKDHVLVVSWIYVFTVILVLTFAIEIGQGWYGVGIMEFDDIVSGVFGFFLLFAIFAVLRFLVLAIVRAVRGDKGKHE